MLKEGVLLEADVYVVSNWEESAMIWHLKLRNMSEQSLKISPSKIASGIQIGELTILWALCYK